MPFVAKSAHRSDAMKIPTMLHDTPDYRSSAQLSSQCLEDLRLQFLAMDQKSKGGHTAMSCHSYSSRTSSSELLLGDEITFSPSDLQSFFSGFSSPVVVSECEFETDIFRDFFAEERLVQIAKDEASLYPTCLNEDILSAEVNPVSYRDFTKPSSFACHANAPAEIGTGIPDSFEGSTLASSADCQNDRKREIAAAAAPSWDNKPCQPSSRVKLMYSFGGRIVSRPYDGKFRYVGGETRIIAVSRNIRYSELMSKLTESHGVALTLKYQIPDEDLDAFISVSSEDDLQNMMEEHDRLEAEGGSSRLRLFLFPPAEYDDHKIQHTDNGDFTNSEKQYVDAVNSISEKISSHPFESGLPSSPRVLAQQNFLNSMSIMREIDAADNGWNAVESIQSMVHQAASGQVSSLIYFPGPPSEPSSTPSSPPTSFQQPYLRQNAAASDMSLQCFRDRLSKLSVYHHVPMDPEIFFQDFDPVYSGASASGQRDRHITFSDFPTFAHSPGPTVCESVARGEQLHTGNLSSTALESQCKSSSVFEQQLEYDFKQCFDYSEISSNGLGEVVSPQIEILHLVQQQQSHHQDQHPMLQKQQYKENIPAVQASQHGTISHCLAVQQPSLYVSYFHSGNSTNKGVSKQLEQHFVNQEGCLPETFARSSVSSHAIAIGGQLAYGLSSPYHKVASPKNHVKHRLQANGTFSDSSVNQPHGRKVQYGDQSSRNLQVCPKFLASADEWEVKHQQHYPTLLAAGFQELDEHSSVHQHEQYSPSWSQLSNSLTSHFLPIYNEISAPCLLENTRTRCQTACHDSTLILNPLAARQSNCIVDYGQKASLALGRDCMNKGNLDEAGKCVEGDCNLSSICERDGFMSPMHLKVGCVPTVSHPWTDWSESFGTVPVTSYPSGSTLDAATMSQGVVTEDLQLDASPMGPRLKETTQLSRIATSRPAAVLDSERISGESRIQPCIPLAMSEAPSRFHMMVDSPLDPMFPSSFSHLPTPRFVSGTDAVDLLNGAHKLEEISEISYAQNLQVQENHIAELMSSPEEAIGWGMGCPNDNNLDENLPGSLSMVFETFNPVQHTCEHVCPCICIHENASTFSGYLGLPASITDAVNGCSSAQLASPPYQQDSLHPSAKVDEQHEVSNLSGPPIYDRSPVGSVNALELSNSCLNPDEREAPHSDPDKDTSTTQMSLTEHLAKDMVCSVLESCEKAREQGDETMKIGEEDVRSRNELQLKDISPPPVQDGKGFTIHQEHLSRETVNVNETLEAVAEERGSSKELDQETSEHIGHNGSYEAGNKCMNRHMAEREALSRGLQIIKNADLEEIRELGSGTFGTVHHGKWKGSDVAIKRIKASCFTGPVSEQKRLILDFWKEACTLAHLHHPNVVAFYGLVPDAPDETLATVTEYMVNGSLKRVLRRKDRTIDRRKRLLLAMDIAFGMEYLHSKNIVHFDLKCENLLVNMKDPHRPICKVGDFGLSKVKQHTLVSGGVRGTLPWMAPELLSGNNNMVTEKIDVFSFGVVMWELLTGEEPYANMHCGTIIGGIVNNTLRPSVPSWCDPAWRSLMERCWSADPANRPAFSEVACELRGIAATMNLK